MIKLLSIGHAIFLDSKLPFLQENIIDFSTACTLWGKYLALDPKKDRDRALEKQRYLIEYEVMLDKLSNVYNTKLKEQEDARTPSSDTLFD